MIHSLLLQSTNCDLSATQAFIFDMVSTTYLIVLFKYHFRLEPLIWDLANYNMCLMHTRRNFQEFYFDGSNKRLPR